MVDPFLAVECGLCPLAYTQRYVAEFTIGPNTGINANKKLAARLKEAESHCP